MNNTEPLFLRAARGENTRAAPVWFMRQAGRFLPEYRALKEKYTFWQMMQTPEIAAEVTLQPVTRLGVDAAILFQDIMTPLPAMGTEIDFSPGPVIRDPIRTMGQVERLRVPAEDEIAPWVSSSIQLIRERAKVPLIGFGGAPLTLAAYLVEGKGTKDYSMFRAFLRSSPVAAHALLDKLTECSIRYLQMQVRSGAQAIQLFDSWAGLHDLQVYGEFALPYVQRIMDGLGEMNIPRIYLALDSHHLWPLLKQSGADAYSVDWRVPISDIRKIVGDKAIQGNLDPALMLAPREVLLQHVERILREGEGGAHIFNLGHGMLPAADPDQVQAVVDFVHQFERGVR